MRKIFLCLALSLFVSVSFSQNLSAEETKLYKLIMEYREQLSLPPIPISLSLTKVARTHVDDLLQNKPNQGDCNMHSWSSKGNWTPCCYTPDHAQANCMWSKPRELTSYPGNGYEIACGPGNGNSMEILMTAESALNEWKASPGHNDVICNKDIWKEMKWNAIGICVSGSYAVAWFGEEPDK
jgi:galactitol-specific phosphotransferase system IIB component